jgi:hypothetical protein
MKKTVVYNGSTSSQIPVWEFDINRIVWKNKLKRDYIVKSISGYELCVHKTNGEVRELNIVTTKNCGHIVDYKLWTKHYRVDIWLHSIWQKKRTSVKSKRRSQHPQRWDKPG